VSRGHQFKKSDIPLKARAEMIDHALPCPSRRAGIRGEGGGIVPVEPKACPSAASARAVAGRIAQTLASGKEQLMVLSDTTNMPALFAKHLGWHSQLDADPVLAEATRRRLFDRAVSDKALVTGYHFPFPAVGTIVPDGAGYTFVPAS
jgi:hypothetical protein